ncbi:MAG: glycogen debranching N-terminal domain-containing protein, partial [Polyangiaceae bacterium]
MDPQGNEVRSEAAVGLCALPTAGDLDRLVRARGAMFLVTTRQGDVAPAGARELGLFYRDTRFLSHYALEIRGRRAVHLNAETTHLTYNQVDLMLSDTAQRSE